MAGHFGELLPRLGLQPATAHPRATQTRPMQRESRLRCRVISEEALEMQSLAWAPSLSPHGQQEPLAATQMGAEANARRLPGPQKLEEEHSGEAAQDAEIAMRHKLGVCSPGPPPQEKAQREDMGGRNAVGGWLPCRRHHSSCPECPQHTPLRTVPRLWEEPQVSGRQRPGWAQGPGPEQQLPAAGERAQGCQREEGSLPLALGREGPALARCDQTASSQPPFRGSQPPTCTEQSPSLRKD